MLLVLLAAASLAAQFYILRDTEARPFDRCAAVRDLCPEESLDSLAAARDSVLARAAAIAAGSSAPSGEAGAIVWPAGIDTSRIGARNPGD
jgi:hypothetical protein